MGTTYWSEPMGPAMSNSNTVQYRYWYEVTAHTLVHVRGPGSPLRWAETVRPQRSQRRFPLMTVFHGSTPDRPAYWSWEWGEWEDET